MTRPAKKSARPPRQPLVKRRRRARAAARARIARRSRRPLRAEQRTFDPTDHGRPHLSARLAAALANLAGSTGVHAAVIGAGILIIGLDSGEKEDPDRRPVKVEIREEKKEPKIEEKVEEKEEPAVVEEKVEPKKEPKRPPEPAKKKEEPPESQEPPGKKPRRVVGLNLESTTQGGDGPSFGTGNTRRGETSDRAADPDDVDPRGADGDAEKPAPSPNKKATRIPTRGAKMVLPKRKKPVIPEYPPELEAQGIEANVPVLVSIDAGGKVTSVKILKKTPYPALDEAARKAALAETFEPATRNGTPIPYTISYTYRFRLKDE